MTLANRKIFIEIAQVFLLTLFVILCLILLGRALQLRDLLFGLEFGLIDTFMLFVYLSPTFLQMAAPIACMISVFIVFLRLDTDREMTALKAGGISLYQLLPAPILLAFLVSLATLYLAIYGISWGMYSFRDSIMDVATNRAKVVVQPGIFNKEIPGFVLYAKNVDPLNGSLSGVLVRNTQSSSSDSLPFSTTTLAPEGQLEVDRENRELLFLLKDGNIYANDDKRSTTLSFEEYIVRIPLNEVFKGLDLGEVSPNEMSFQELIEISPTDPRMEDSFFANRIMIEKHSRFVFAFMCFVLSLLAVPLASACSGVKKQLGLAIAFSVFILYYGLITLGINFGKNVALDPLLGVWLPNLVFLALSIFMIRHYTHAIK